LHIERASGTISLLVAATRPNPAALEAAIIDSFGGFTLYPASAVGGWRNAAGVTFSDATRIYGIAVVTIVDGDKLGALARFAKAFYAQEAIFIRYLGIIEIL